nr:hypothetical protein [Gemmatales bacterium]
LGHESPIRYLAISPQGDVLASGSEDGKIVLWETSTGNILGTLTSHQSLIRALAFSSDGKKLLSVDRDQLLKLWDVPHQREIQSLFSKSDGVNRLAFLPGDEGIIASIGSAQICLWKIEGEQINPEPVKTFLGYERHCNSTAFAQGRIALGSTDGNIVHKKMVKFQPELDELIHCFKVAVHEITMSSDGQRLLAVNQENEFKIWNLTDNKQLSTWKGRSARLTALALNAAGNRALASFDNGEIVLWDDTGKELRSWKFRSLATDLIFSPVAAHAYSSTGNGVLFQLDLP